MKISKFLKRNKLYFKNKNFSCFVLKRNFLLIEMVIAFALFALCGTFFISRPYLVFRKELQLLTEIECERIAENSLSEIQKNFCNDFPFDSFVRNQKKAKELRLEPIILKLSPHQQVTIERVAKVWEKRSFEGENSARAKIIKCQLTLKIPPQQFGLKKKNKKEFLKTYEWRFFIKEVPFPRQKESDSL